jgi:hypothetical protein
MSALPPGRRAAALSVGLGVVALAAWYSITRFHLLDNVQLPAGLLPQTEASEAVWVAFFAVVGIAGAPSGLVALVRARGWTRAGGLLGLLLGVLAIFVGTLPLWFSLPNPLGTGSFG